MSHTLPIRVQLHLQRAQFALKVDLQLPTTGITVLFGPSGCGKTTLLRCVAGLEHAQGTVTIGNTVWQDSAQQRFTPTWQRDIGYVFQEASLFEHLNVQRNLSFGMKRVNKHGGEQALKAAIALLGIEHLLKRRVQQLSGGERQRVAIARALATQPQLLLLDEPLAALDPARRKDVLPWLEKLRDELNIPMLYVTHAMDELARLADHLVMLDNGQVHSSGTVAQVFANTHIALAAGDEAGIIYTATVLARDAQDHLMQVSFEQNHLWIRDQNLALGSPVRLRLLARDISLSTNPNADNTIQNRLSGHIHSIEPDVHPSQALVKVRCGSSLVLARVTWRAIHQLSLAPGNAVWCQLKSVAVLD